jgi:hypothetical protein
MPRRPDMPTLVRRWRPRFASIVTALADIEGGSARRKAAGILRTAAGRLRPLAGGKGSLIRTAMKYNERRARSLEVEEILIPIREDFVDLQHEIDKWNIEPNDWSTIRMLLSRYSSPLAETSDSSRRHLRVERRKSGGRPTDYPRHAAILIAAELWEEEKHRPATPSQGFITFCDDVLHELGFCEADMAGLDDLVQRVLKGQVRSTP